MKSLPPEAKVLAILRDNTRQKEQHQVITLIYENIYPIVKNYIKKRLKKNDLCKEIFQEVLLRVVLKIREKGEEGHYTYQAKGKFAPFIMGVTKRVLREHFKVRPFSEYDPKHDLRHDTTLTLKEIKQLEAEDKLYLKHFEALKRRGKGNCYKILQWRIYERWPLSKIQQEMGWTLNYTRKKVYECRKFLIKQIKNDPDYLNLSLEKNILYMQQH